MSDVRPNQFQHSVWIALLTLAPIFAASASAQVRPEIHPVQTITLNTQQVLLGNQSGPPAAVAGVLRIPISSVGRIPAVILIHGSGGLSESQERWAKEINSLGVAAFVLDCFSGRGIVNTSTDQSQLDSLAMLVDAYRALALLDRDPRIDSSRVAVMGFSKGAVAAVYSSMERFRKTYAPPDLRFAAHIGLYTPCYKYRDDEKVVTGKPIRLFHGAADDYVPIGPCRDYVARLKKLGVDISLTEYPGAYHAYDNALYRNPNGPGPMFLPQAQTTRNCALEEGDHGVMLVGKTGRPFSYSEPCIERGAHIGYDEAAMTATTVAVREFLGATFKLKL